MIYHNEIEPFAQKWIRELMREGAIPEGDIDGRDMRDVCAADIIDYTQVHLFSGIAGWSYALDLAGWPVSREAWTCSCPCQPFSQAGSGAGFADERHLWPSAFWLIEQCRPATIFGEQVASPLGRTWLDLVFSDLEGIGYACRAADLCSAGVGAPNIRQRLYWMADAGRGRFNQQRRDGGKQNEARPENRLKPNDGCATGGLVDPEIRGRGEHGLFGQAAGEQQDTGHLGNAGNARLSHAEPCQVVGAGRREEGRATTESGSPHDPWRELEWIACRDGKMRPTQPGLFPLAPRLPWHVGALRGSGNAINPHVAAEFIKACM
jgi:DNA (cytosine-5)-methyltransferase 1